MSPSIPTSKVIGFAIAAMLLCSVDARAEVVKNKAVIHSIRGNAQVSFDKGQTWKAAKIGASLAENSMVKTASNSHVNLFLGVSGPLLRVDDDTLLAIDKLEVEKEGIEERIETQLDLRRGRILGIVKKMAAEFRYEIKTLVGVAGIRGGAEFDINADGVVRVISGEVIVVYVSGFHGLLSGEPGQIVTPFGGPNKGPQVRPMEPGVIQKLKKEVEELALCGAYSAE